MTIEVYRLLSNCIRTAAMKTVDVMDQSSTILSEGDIERIKKEFLEEELRAHDIQIS